MIAGLKVGRVTKLVKPETVRAAVDARSIAANPFPWKITREEVEVFFSQYGEVYYFTLLFQDNKYVICFGVLE
jgi:hypothetical protein